MDAAATGRPWGANVAVIEDINWTYTKSEHLGIAGDMASVYRRLCGVQYL